MPRGGKRTPGEGKKLGRPKTTTRPVDGNVARKIKERVKAEELWVFLIGKAAQKAKDTGNTNDLRHALEYLDDRDWGRPTQTIAHEEPRVIPELEFGNLIMPSARKPGTAGKPN